jgi:putative ABC transport system permease protein
MRGAAVAVINQTMARQFWPNTNPVGQQLRLPDLKDEPYSPVAPGIAGAWMQIVGVVADALDEGLRKPIKPAIYVPYTVKMYMFTQILIRTRIPPASMLRDIRAQVVHVDPDQQVTHAQDLETWIVNEHEYGQQRFMATLFGVFSVLALVLAAVGLYSVVSYGVATRTNEFGIRLALGARAADVFRLVLSSTSISLSIGLTAGLILSNAFNKLSTKWVSESSRDPLILAGVTLILVAAAASASFVPARRAASVDPMAALRYE